MAFREIELVLLTADLAGYTRATAHLPPLEVAAFLEGWYVVPGMRRRGVGRALVAAAENWGRIQGCSEFASDMRIDNLDSAAAHHALGFIETGQLRCFRKDLGRNT